MSGGHAKPKDPNLLPVNHFGYFPGYWTELVILHNWPPDWAPADDWGANEVARAAQASENRDERLAVGDTGAIHGLSNKSDARIALYSADGAAVKWMGSKS